MGQRKHHHRWNYKNKTSEIKQREQYVIEHHETMTKSEMADALCTHEYCIRDILRKHGLRALDPDIRIKEQILKYNERLNAKDMAEEIPVSIATLQRVARKYDLTLLENSVVEKRIRVTEYTNLPSPYGIART